MPIIRAVLCDGCGEMMYWVGNVSKACAASIARDKGWAIGKQCLCPDCKPKGECTMTKGDNIRRMLETDEGIADF